MIGVLMVEHGLDETRFGRAKSKRHDRNPSARSVPKASETEDMFS